MRYLLNMIKELGGVYEHKLVDKFSVQLVNSAITQGFAERFDKSKDLPVKGIRITPEGETELQRLTIEANKPRQPDPISVRLQELRQRLKDDTITASEVKELLRIVLRV